MKSTKNCTEVVTNNNGTFIPCHGWGPLAQRWLDWSSRNQKSQTGCFGCGSCDCALCRILAPWTFWIRNPENNGVLVETSPFVDPGLVLRRSESPGACLDQEAQIMLHMASLPVGTRNPENLGCIGCSVCVCTGTDAQTHGHFR